MDWDYIVSLQPDGISDNEKEDLYNTITWFDCASEKIDVQKAVSLLKVSQEILKYKGEQVETLLHQLDELATKQGEDEVRKMESDTDGRSSKSRKSSSIEFENLEQKYIELRAKYKKQVKNGEKMSSDIKKLNSKISTLVQEKNHLINEMQVINQEDSQSDMSEAVKEQHNELVETVHNKNRQISDLLQDIEAIEKENMVLREKLTVVRDKLSVATKELKLLTETLNGSKLELEESQEMNTQLTVQNENLKEELKEAVEQKAFVEQQIEEFTVQVDSRVDEWTRILSEKEKEIDELKSTGIATSPISSDLSVVPTEHQSQVAVLNRIVRERDNQLMELKSLLQEATKEIQETTTIINDLNSENATNQTKINELTGSLRDERKLLKSAHERCRELQDNVDYAEKLAASKDNDLTEILDQLNNDGRIELSEKLKLIQGLKSQNRLQEKQIMNLVKASNKLQDVCDQFVRENEILRDRLGLAEDERIASVPFRQKHQKKELEQLKKTISNVKEENLGLRSAIQKSNRAVAVLSDQLIDSGQTPNLDGDQLVSGGEQDEMHALAEENEALRKGLHEILNSVNVQNESSLNEIKSDVLEQLLRALDVRHVSGWYHPAMRLQAELHNLQGVNSELRKQLQLTKMELQTHPVNNDGNQEVNEIKNTTPYSVNLNKLTNADAQGIIEIKQQLQNLWTRLEDSAVLDKYEGKLESFKEHLEVLYKQIEILYAEYADEKQLFEEKQKTYELQINELEQLNEINLEKLKVFNANATDEIISKSLELSENNVVFKRKCRYLENETRKLYSNIDELKAELAEAESVCVTKINELIRKNRTLSTSVHILNNKLTTAIDPARFNGIEATLNNLTVKHRDLLHNFAQLKDNNIGEIKILKESLKIVDEEKADLKTLIADLLQKLHSRDTIENYDENVEMLAKKVSAAEVNEISERQRANHTNNLYELVKEQLEKSEERFMKVENYNKDILQNNYHLQEQLKVAETKLCMFVDVNVHKGLQDEYNNLLQENDKLSLSLNEVTTELKLMRQNNANQRSWCEMKELEFLNLKHQIVDLQAMSDEKMQIAQLSSELNDARLKATESRTKIGQLNEELKTCRIECEMNSQKLELNLTENDQQLEQLKQKISILQHILDTHAEQYLGSIPLTSEEKFINNITEAIKNKHETFINLLSAQISNHESSVIKQQYEKEMQTLKKALQLVLNNKTDEINRILSNYEENKIIQFNEMKYRRQFELKEKQFDHVMERIRMQDGQLVKLEEELFSLHKSYNFGARQEGDFVERKYQSSQQPSPAKSPIIKLYKTVDVQTAAEIADTSDDGEGDMNKLRAQLLNADNEATVRDQTIQQLKSKQTELEMKLSLFTKQLGDKQSQIVFYERHIMELQAKKDTTPDETSIKSEEIHSLKSTIKSLQENMRQKSEDILKYQSLLKEDRDKHSLAAALMQEELKVLQKSLNDEKQNTLELKSSMSDSHPNKATLQQYFAQVHMLEEELATLRTKSSGLESQLQASRQEAVRWRTLANDRLMSMEKLGKELEDLHENELQTYKKDSEKWRDEVGNLKQLIAKYRSDKGYVSDVQKLLKEKDDKIHELVVWLRQAKGETKRMSDRSDASDSTSKLNDLETAKDQLIKEHDILKKRFDQLLNKERSARDEIRELKSQLLKKPISSARSDKSDKVTNQLQKKVSSLESEIAELQDNLSKQIAINESHKIKIGHDFDMWSKQKHWQQTAEKLKNKLKAKDSAFDKIQLTCATYKGLIGRLEREKLNLENKLKYMRSDSGSCSELRTLRRENDKLLTENGSLYAKLEMQQHHSGGLGAAMLQEKLEGQERKIAILELSTKAPQEVRGELERYQTATSNLQKTNLRLEAENLELKLDLEKTSKEVPHLREQIQHLENYIQVLQCENSKTETATTHADGGGGGAAVLEPKKTAELERTIFILRRVIQKLQVENKRLMGGKRLCGDRTGAGDKRDYQRLKEQYSQSVQKVSQLQRQLDSANNLIKTLQHELFPDNASALSGELNSVKEQLRQKSELLNKVKVLLRKAAEKEKLLLQEVSQLKLHVDNCTQQFSDN